MPLTTFGKSFLKIITLHSHLKHKKNILQVTIHKYLCANNCTDKLTRYDFHKISCVINTVFFINLIMMLIKNVYCQNKKLY